LGYLLSFKKKIAEVLGYSSRYSLHAVQFNAFIEVLVLLNVLAVILESFDEFSTTYSSEFNIFEIVTVTIFSLEFLGRMWVSDMRYPTKYRWQAYRKFLLTPMAWIDLLAIIPFFIAFVVNLDLRHIRILRMVRLLRVFNLSKYSHSLRLINRIIIEKKQELAATFLLFLSVLIVSATAMHWLEKEVQPDKFPTILHSCWWAVITLTTIGYGDIYPITAAGRFLGAAVVILGVIITAIPVGIVSSGFVQKMEETNYRRRITAARRRMRDAFYKKYVPEIACKVRRGQLSVDAVKVNLELSEEDLYKIAEGNNEFRFRYKRVVIYGRTVDKLFIEYRSINTLYGYYCNKNHRLTLVSPDSLSKQSIGYFVYCLSEKLKCNYISNEFFGDEAEVHEESFGDKGLTKDAAFNFRHNNAYFRKTNHEEPHAFALWKQDLERMKTNNSLFLVFTSYEKEDNDIGFVHLTYLKNKAQNENEMELSYPHTERVNAFAHALENKAEAKWGKKMLVSQNGDFATVNEYNILLYLHDKVGVDVLVINIYKEYLLNEKLFSCIAIMAESIKEDLVGIQV
jgi:voltage-gated potassium channel